MYLCGLIKYLSFGLIFTRYTKAFSFSVVASNHYSDFCRMKKLLLLLCNFSISLLVNAQDYELVPFRKGDQWGFAERDKTVFITPQHDEVFPFKNGFAKVRNGTRYGIINMKGEIIVPIQFDAVSEMSEGLFAVRQGVFPKCLSGYYDTTGKTAIPFKFVDAFPFENGKAMVKVGVFPDLKHVFIDRTGKLLDYYGASGKYLLMGKPSEGLTSFSQGGKWGYINSDGIEVIKPTYEEAGDFREGFAAVKQKGKYGYIDRSGTTVIPFKYDMAGDFYKGVAIVYVLVKTQDEWGSGETPKYGLISKNKVEISPMQYDFIGLFNKEGIAIAKKGNKHSLITLSGKELIPFQYDFISEFNEGIAVVKSYDTNTRKSLSGLIDKTGKEIYPLSDIRFSRFSEGLIAFEKNKKVGFMNAKGEIIIPAKFDSFYWKNYDRSTGTSEFKNGICAVIKDGQLVYINTKGEEFAAAE